MINNLEKVIKALLTPQAIEDAIARANVPDVFVERIEKVEAMGNTVRVYVVLASQGYYKGASITRRTREFYLGANEHEELVIS